MNKQHKGISRREFITRVAMLGSLAACYPAAALEQLRSTANTPAKLDWTSQEPWETLAAVQEHLFPSTEHALGAGDIQAIVYLRNTLERPAADGEDKDFIAKGVGWLNDLTVKEYQQSFVTLNEQQCETVLRQIEETRAGRNWLSLLLTYLLEALLSDPVYGGNPDGIGWQWLEHQPGFPAPPEDKTWYRLAAPVHFQRKA